MVAWNRSSEKAQHLSEVGITVEELASSALLSTDVALLLLADADAIREALFGGASQAAIKGKTILQMGTIGKLVLSTRPKNLAGNWNFAGD